VIVCVIVLCIVVVMVVIEPSISLVKVATELVAKV
jgi:hypothetical protein